MSAYNSEAPVLDTYQAVVLAYSDFLTVSFHTILHERNIYPQNSFIAARKYNLAVRQNRHPKVCKWIQDAVAAVETEMLKCTVARTSLILHAPPPTATPLERYVFSTSSFPRIPPSEAQTPFAPPNTSAIGNQPTESPQQQPKDSKRYYPPPTSNLPEQFRATLARLMPAMARLKPLPEGCSFTLAIELRDDEDVEAPLRRGEDGGRWIAAEPNLQRERQRGGGGGDAERQEIFEGRKEWGRDLGGVKTTPVRSVEAGAFAMEVWVEEGKGKFVASVEDAAEEAEDESVG